MMKCRMHAFVLRSVQGSRSNFHAYTVNPNQATNPIVLGFAESPSQYINSSISLPFSLFFEEIESRLLPSNWNDARYARANQSWLASNPLTVGWSFFPPLVGLFLRVGWLD